MFEHWREQIRLGIELGGQQADESTRAIREASWRRIHALTEQSLVDMGQQNVEGLGEHCPEDFRRAIANRDIDGAVQVARGFASHRNDTGSPDWYVAFLLGSWLENIEHLRGQADDARRRIDG